MLLRSTYGDGIKSQYPKGCECEICGTTEDLEYHHYHTLSILLKQYSVENNIPIDTDEQVLAMRDKFYEDNWEAVVTDGVTLCNTHHKKLHKIYGREPSLSTAKKQKQWVKNIKDRESGKDSHPIIKEVSGFGRFSKHLQKPRVGFSTLTKGV